MNTQTNNIQTAETDASHLTNIRLKPNFEWKTVEVNGEDVEIPLEWKVLTLGNISNVKTSGVDKIIRDNEKIVNLLNYMDVYKNPSKTITSQINYKKTSLQLEKIEANLVKRGDIYFTPSSETSDDIGHAGVSLEDFDDLVYSYHLIRVRPIQNVLEPLFSSKIFNNKLTKNYFSKMAQGITRMTLKKEAFENYQFISPSILEQTLIAQTLTTQEEYIDTLKKQAVVERNRLTWLTDELLCGRIRVKEDHNGQPTVLTRDEQGQVVDSLPAVVLVANTEWKTVEVNGEDIVIPQEWEVKTMDKCGHIVAGQSPDGILVLKEPINQENIDFHQGNANFGEKYTVLSNKTIKRNKAPKIAQKGSLLLSVRAPVGELNYASNEICFGRGLCNIQAKNNNLDYLKWKIQTAKDELNKLATGTTFLAVTNSQISKFEITIPNYKEQTLIAQTLTSQEEYISAIEQMVVVEEKRLEWLTDELLSGRILIEEVE